jgi:hypothetical protein
MNNPLAQSSYNPSAFIQAQDTAPRSGILNDLELLHRKVAGLRDSLQIVNSRTVGPKPEPIKTATALGLPSHLTGWLGTIDRDLDECLAEMGIVLKALGE